MTKAEKLEEAKRMWRLWHEAEIARSTGASYSIAGRSLTRVSNEEIQMMKRKYAKIIRKLEGRTVSRTSGYFPIDR